MQVTFFWFRDPKNIGLHHKFLKFLRFLDKPRSLQPSPGFFLMQANIFWFRDPKNIGLHHKFLTFLRFLDKGQVPYSFYPGHLRNLRHL